MKTEIIKCHCGKSFEWEPFTWDKTKTFRPDACPSCEEREAALKEAERIRIQIANNVASARESVTDSLPAAFQITDTTHPRFNAKDWNKLKDWKPTPEKPWLGIIGETGLSKTRIVSLLAIKEAGRMAGRWSNGGHHQNPKFEFTTGYRICELAGSVQTGSYDEKETARRELNRVRRCDILIIDDLGKGKITDTAGAALFALIDHRYANLKITYWTSNSTPEEIAVAMDNCTAGPFAGRINDHSRIVRLRSLP